MKDILLRIIESDTSYNKSATKMLRKTHPDLWNEVLEQTKFLPKTALPKQRIWHILNECNIRPTCPITGEFVKWCEKKYNTYSSLEAKNKDIGRVLSNAISGENHWRNKNPDKSKKANEKFSKGLSSGRIVIDRSKRDTKAILDKAKQTYLKNYGVDNPSKHSSIKQKISDSQISNGAIPKHLRNSKRLYYEAVGKFTGESWKNNFDQINPTRLNRSEYDLDHIYSKHQGFKDNIPPYIIGHWTNLRMLSKSENSSKGSRCDKTSEQLFEDFFKNIIAKNSGQKRGKKNLQHLK